MPTFSSVNLAKLAVHLADYPSLPSESMSEFPLAGNGKSACAPYTDPSRSQERERERERGSEREREREREGGREGGREGVRQGERETGRERERERGREGGREGGTEEEREDKKADGGTERCARAHAISILRLGRPTRFQQWL